MPFSRHRPAFAAAAAGILAMALAATPGAATTTAGTAASTGGQTVTLITGDRVEVVGDRKVVFRPAKGREKIGFTNLAAAGHHYVIPADAVAAVNAGALDRRLFDVKMLLSYGYDDAHRKDLPLILRHQPGAAAKTQLAGVSAKRDFPALGMSAVRASKAAAAAFWDSVSSGRTTRRTVAGIAKIWLDGKRTPTLSESVPQIGAPAAWQAGHTGKGSTVAVLDTGIDATHPDLTGAITAAKDFTGGNDPDDRVGHGTHVASTIAGSGAASNGKYKGVAPDTKLANAKVCGSYDCPESAILDGMTWATQTVHAKVVNLSLGGPDVPGTDPLEEAVDTLSATTGTLFVIAAGNSGPAANTVDSPGNAKSALTVGAVTKQDALAGFSGRGPRAEDDAIKPDIAAPGAGIVAAKAENGVIGDPSGDPRYVSLNGTSMATPHVAGSAAILAAVHPDWTGSQLKAALMAAARRLSGIGVFGQGAGRVDVGQAVKQEIVVNPPSLSVPTARWPHDDDEPVTRTLTYHNGGKTPVTLALSVEATGPDGTTAPAGLFSLSTKTVTIAAGADAAVVVTTNPKAGTKVGEYTGQIVATASGDRSIQTPIAVNVEPETYNVTVSHTNRAGKPTGIVELVLFDYDGQKGWFTPVPDSAGVATVRLPKGRYALWTQIFEDDESTKSVHQQPLVNLTGDTKIHVDARQAKPMKIKVDKPSARSQSASVSATFAVPGRAGIIETFTPAGHDHLFLGPLGPAVPSSMYRALVTSVMAEPGPDGTFTNSPYQYHLAYPATGRLPAGITAYERVERLATVHNHQRSTSPGNVGRMAWPTFADVDAGSPFLEAGAPGTVTQYFTPDTVAWSLGNQQEIGPPSMGSPQLLQGAKATIFRRGSTTTEIFNSPVFGPGLAQNGLTGSGVALTTQYPAYLVARAHMFADGNPAHNGRIASQSGSPALTQSLRLYRDGTKVAEALDGGYAVYEAPSADATFRMDASFHQQLVPVSTKIDSSWTFRSVRTQKPEGVALPLFTLRFNPLLDDTNAAPGGGPFTIPVAVDRQEGAAPATITGPTIEYSTDDGRTWHRATTKPTGTGTWAATVDNPASGFVALRSNATDSAGNTNSTTIIRAYAIK